MNTCVNKKYKITKVVLMFWCLFIGVGAFFGGISMLIKPDGSILQMQSMLKYFKVLPFSDVLFNDYTFSGGALIVVNGITNIIATVLIAKNKKVGVVLGAIFGFTLMLWITIQFVIFPFNVLSTSYFVFGVCQLITGCFCLVFFLQSKFEFNEKNYENIGKNKKDLVVYFSRGGYVKKVAFELANQSGADVLEITTPERTKGFLGFMWCGRFGMHKWSMPITYAQIDLEKYEKVTICSPIWVFSVCAPIRAFAQNNAGKIKQVDYVFVHFMNGIFTKPATELDKTLGVSCQKITNVCCRFGKVVKTTINQQ